MDTNNGEIPKYAEALLHKGKPDNITSKYSIKYTTPRFKTHTFKSEINDSTINFHIIKMDNSFFIWIGRDSEPNLSDLSIAMMSPYQKEPLSTKIIGQVLDSSSANLASRLTKKLNKQVYLSCNIIMDRLFLPIVDKCISEEIKLVPSFFS